MTKLVKSEDLKVGVGWWWFLKEEQNKFLGESVQEDISGIRVQVRRTSSTRSCPLGMCIIAENNTSFSVKFSARVFINVK